MIDYKEHIDKPKTVFIYFDDVIATGGTVVRDLSEWLETKSDGVNENYKLILNKSKSLVLSTFCYHQLGFGNMEYRLMKKFDDKIKKVLIVKKDYVIENQARWNNQRLNCAFPVSTQSPPVFKYLSNFSELRGNDSVFRNVNKPINETFFTNPTNRNRLETIFINKGLELLNKVKSSDVDFSKRPLGYTVRSHKTLGTGTLFFTWRNVSNTCPLVFWWDVPGHNWLPLFGLKNRGL